MSLSISTNQNLWVLQFRIDIPVDPVGLESVVEPPPNFKWIEAVEVCELRRGHRRVYIEDAFVFCMRSAYEKYVFGQQKKHDYEVFLMLFTFLQGGAPHLCLLVYTPH